MTHIYAICNQKGGVGKTTTAINLAASLAATQQKVLLADLDPQGNATTGCGLNKNQLEAGCADVLTARTPLRDAIHANLFGFDLLPGNAALTHAEVGLMSEQRREYRLRDALQNCGYDYVLLDCPPSLNILSVNGLIAADRVLVPIQCEFYALEGLEALMNTVERIGQRTDTQLQLAGILRTMYDPRNNLAHEVSQKLLDHFGDRVYRTLIPRNVALAEAPGFGQPALFYQRTSPGAVAYLALAGEILRRQDATDRKAA